MARPRKLSTDNLLEIVKKYLSENQYITTLKFSDLAQYSKDLGYENITYQDFSRNKTIKAFVDEYKKQKKMTMYSKLNTDKLEKLNFNVEDVVDKNIKDKKQLKIILKIFKDGYDRAFDKLIEGDNTIKEFQNKIKYQDKSIKELKEKNRLLRNQLNEIKETYKINKALEKEKWMYLAIKDMVKECNIPINSEEQLLEILKNLGYSNQSDIINKEDIINNELKNIENNIVLKENKEEKVIPIKKNKRRLKIPDFMK